MHEQSDARLLREYTEHGNDAAFHEIVDRHTDLVYSSALRQVNSPDLARDVAQSVFTDLARKARSLATTLTENASLLGWLYRSTRFAALTQLRNARRRQARERQVMQHFDPGSETPPEWDCVRPILDEAIAELSDEDRDALLLRYFKSRDFRAIGEALGVSDDAAQKRVSRALERLRGELTRRGVSGTAVALSTVLATNAGAVAPSGLAGTLSTAALAGKTLAATTTLAATKAIAMTTLQKTLITGTIIAVVSAGIYETRQAANLRTLARRLQQQEAANAGQSELLDRERNDAMSAHEALQRENERLRQTAADVPRLRAELARLQAVQQQLAQMTPATANQNDPFTQSILALTARAKELNRHLEQMPDKRIPELQLLSENDWLTAAKDAKFDTDADIRKALSKLRSLAKDKVPIGSALYSFTHANDGQLPTDLSQLKPYFKVPVDDAILERYKILHTGNLSDFPTGEWFVTEKAFVDKDYDELAIFGNGFSTSTRP